MITGSGRLKADSVRLTEFSVRVAPGPEGSNIYTSFQGKYALLNAATGEVVGTGNFDQPGKVAGDQLHELVLTLETNLCQALFEGEQVAHTTTDSDAQEEEAPVDDVPGL